MLAKFGSYFIAFIILALIDLPFSPFMMALVLVSKRVKWLLPFLFCLFDLLKICCGILLASWIIHKLGQPTSWLMFLIPGLLLLRNNYMRINRVKSGKSNVQRLLDQCYEPNSYDQKYDLLIERSHLFGEMVGWVIGTNLVLQSASIM